MAWTKVRQYLDRHIRRLGSLLIGASVVTIALAHFVPPIEEFIVETNIFSILIIGFMVVVLDHLVELHPAPAKPEMELYARHTDATVALEKYLAARQVTKADLIEYSARTINDLLQELRAVNCEIRLLLQHPDAAGPKFQHQRIRESIADLTKVVFENYNRVEIRCYRLPASIRARCFDDDQVFVGWYRYVGGDTWVAGHTNPMIAAISHNPAGKELLGWFRSSFDALWNHPDTVPVSDVMLDT